jgi:hypothetical protein
MSFECFSCCSPTERDLAICSSSYHSLKYFFPFPFWYKRYCTDYFLKNHSGTTKLKYFSFFQSILRGTNLKIRTRHFHHLYYSSPKRARSTTESTVSFRQHKRRKRSLSHNLTDRALHHKAKKKKHQQYNSLSLKKNNTRLSPNI